MGESLAYERVAVYDGRIKVEDIVRHKGNEDGDLTRLYSQRMDLF